MPWMLAAVLAASAPARLGEQLREVSPADQAACQPQERFMDVGPVLPADP
jgi:hypothetical protein